MQKYISEFCGSFFLVLALGLAGDALSSGLLVIGIIYAGKQFSGAHYNPAVSLAFWAAGRLPGKTLSLYFVSQAAGALSGCLLIFLMAGATFLTVPATSASPFQYTIVEFLFGFLFAMVYLTFFLTPYFRDNRIYGLAIGLTYAGMLMAGGPVTGGVFNPAVSLSTSIVDYFSHGDSYRYLPAYILATASGGIIAGNLFRILMKRGALLTEEE